MSVPPLLRLAEGRKPRARKAPADRPKEIGLHMNVAGVLRSHCLPEWQWTHIPNGERRDIRTAAKLKQMGVRRGWPDFVLISPSGQLRCIELKRQGEGLTEDQETFRLWCITHSVSYIIAHSFDEVLTAFDQWGCLRIKIGGAR